MGAILHALVSVSQMAFHGHKVEHGCWSRSELPLGAHEWSLYLLLSMSYTIIAQTYPSKDVRYIWPASSHNALVCSCNLVCASTLGIAYLRL